MLWLASFELPTIDKLDKAKRADTLFSSVLALRYGRSTRPYRDLLP